MQAPYVACTNARNEFGKVVLVRDTPFRSTTTDVGQIWGRFNIDFQFMPRTLDPDELIASTVPAGGVVQPTNPPHVVPQTDPKLALAMYGVRLQLPCAPLLRRFFHSIVAMHQAAHNCDYYITTYQGKSMEQFQSLLVHIALDLQRLEADLSSEQPEEAIVEERARRTTLRIATAANRCSWCSVCELACYITTGSLARKTHVPVSIFLTRPMYMLQECRRILQLGKQMLVDAPNVEQHDARVSDALVFTGVATAGSAAEFAASSAASSAAQAATSSVALPVGAPTSSNPENSAAEPAACVSEAEDLGDNSDTAISEAAEDVDNNVETLEITTLKNASSLHDD